MWMVFFLFQGLVVALDDSVVDGDQVDYLIKFCPTKEEMELLKVQFSSCSIPLWNIIRFLVNCILVYQQYLFPPVSYLYWHGNFQIFQSYTGKKENLGNCEQVFFFYFPCDILFSLDDELSLVNDWEKSAYVTIKGHKKILFLTLDMEGRATSSIS